MPTVAPRSAAFVGLGVMGWPMAGHLYRTGYLHAVFNRTAARARQFIEAHPNTLWADSPQSVTKNSEVIFLCVSADHAVLDVVDQLTEVIRPGQIVIDCSTVSPKTASLAAQRLESKGAHFLDAPVTGGVEGARQGTLSVMVGGADAVIARARPLLETFSSRLIPMGPTGSGQAAKAVNQVMCAGINEAVTEALAFADALGLDLEKVIDAVSGGAAGNWFLDRRGLSMIRGHYEPGFKLALHLKDLGICLQIAESLGYSLPLTELTRSHYETLVAEGMGEEDISALYRLKRHPA